MTETHCSHCGRPICCAGRAPNERQGSNRDDVPYDPLKAAVMLPWIVGSLFVFSAEKASRPPPPRLHGAPVFSKWRGDDVR